MIVPHGKLRNLIASIGMSVVLLVTISSSLPGCGGKVPGTGSTAIIPAPPRGVTGTISTGTPVTAVTAPISPGGGKITVTDESSPIAGLEISVPANSYAQSQQFKVSYAPVEKHSFGSNFNPVTPLITIENGESYSSDLMTVKIPINVPEGNFAMGFYYDANTGTLEGMPLIASDSNSITVATRHFSSFIISLVSEALLSGNVDTGYKPGVDDWQLNNEGSIIVGGQCAGQSISSIWYYYQQPYGEDAHLYNRYDNDGDPKYKTPSIKADDSLAIKLVTSLQVDYEDKNLDLERKFRQMTRVNDATTFKLFAYSMLITGAPQLLVTSSGVGGHALVAYKIANGLLYVADPNYPGSDDEKYGYNAASGKFESGYTLYYMATSALVSWQQVAERWEELKSGTIGKDRYPTYDILILGDKGDFTVLKDGYISPNKMITLRVAPNAGTGSAKLKGPVVYGSAGSNVKDDTTKEVELKSGNNHLGIRVNGTIPTVIEGSSWAGFKYYNITYSAMTIEPASMDGEVNKNYTFTANTESPPDGAEYEWSVDGKTVQSGESDTLTTQFSSEGSYTVSARLLDGDGKEVATGQATANIKKPVAAASGKLAMLQKTNRFQLDLETWGNYLVAFGPTTPDTIQQPFRILVPQNTEIVWSGTSFSGKGDGFQFQGTISPDGSEIATFENTVANGATTASLKLAHVPLKVDEANRVAIPDSARAAQLQKAVVSVAYHDVTTGTETTLLSLVTEGPKAGLSLKFIFQTR